VIIVTRARVVPVPLILTSLVLAAAALRQVQARWGATDAEVAEALPGDHLVPAARLFATRAVDIDAPPSTVWPWVAQLGQGRGGFYSYDVLENLAGCDIHSAHEVVPRWQDVAVGDEVHLAPEVALEVADVSPPEHLVLHGGVAPGASAPPFDFTWAFVLHPTTDGGTRLLVRERYGWRRPWVRPLLEVVQGVSFVMTERMLRGIRDRAERTRDPAGAAGPCERRTARPGLAPAPRPSARPPGAGSAAAWP
jgi:uncharacterized protein YndB with AHSA1/START domain